MNTLITIVAVMNLSVCGGVKTGKLVGFDSSLFDALFEINLDTGEATVLHFFDLDFTGGDLSVGPDGTLYASFTGDIDSLVIVDAATGELTIVGPFGFETVTGLAFSTDGMLYGFDTASDQLITIDPLTGEGTAVGFTVASGGAMEFTRDATLYLVGTPGPESTLYTIDPDTGEATEVGPFGSGLAYSAGLAAVGDVLYASVHWCAGPPYDLLVTLDRETGEATQIGGFCPGKGCPNMSGLAFLPGTGDADRDGDVDLDDFAIFQFCFTGPLEPENPLPVECRFLDTDKDNDLDLQDFADFQGAFTGPNDDGE